MTNKQSVDLSLIGIVFLCIAAVAFLVFLIVVALPWEAHEIRRMNDDHTRIIVKEELDKVFHNQYSPR